MEQDSLLTALERERDELQERLLAGKETMVAQEQEIQAKETRYSHTWPAVQSADLMLLYIMRLYRHSLPVCRVCELVSSWQSLKSTSDAERGLIASEQQKV